MKRAFLGLLIGVLSLILLPPLWYGIFPEEGASLPPPGRRIPVEDGISVNSVEQGSGPPVVLVHGSPGSAYDWKPTQQALVEQGYRVLTYDRVGYGYSDARPDEVYTVELSGRELLALLEHEALEEVTLVGWSYGGLTSMAAALEDPTRIARLVLVGSAGWAEDPPTLPPGVEGAMNMVLPWLAQVPPAERSLQTAFSQQAFAPSPVPDWWLPQLEANFHRPGTQAAWLGEQATFQWAGPDPAPIERPILVIHGRQDTLVPVAVGEWLHERSGDSRLRVIEQGGHMLPITHADALAKEIATFIEAQP